MDFGTIESNLENNWYKSLEEFIADVKLVFTNCFTFNEEGNWAHKIGLKMQDEFERLASSVNFNFYLQPPPSMFEKLDFGMNSV